MCNVLNSTDNSTDNCTAGVFACRSLTCPLRSNRPVRQWPLPVEQWPVQPRALRPLWPALPLVRPALQPPVVLLWLALPLPLRRW